MQSDESCMNFVNFDINLVSTLWNVTQQDINVWYRTQTSLILLMFTGFMNAFLCLIIKKIGLLNELLHHKHVHYTHYTLCFNKYSSSEKRRFTNTNIFEI